jgi:hypothetical protein
MQFSSSTLTNRLFNAPDDDVPGLGIFKPSLRNDPINPKSPGVIPVAIPTTDAFNATLVDGRIVCLGVTDKEGSRFKLVTELWFEYSPALHRA